MKTRKTRNKLRESPFGPVALILSACLLAVLALVLSSVQARADEDATMALDKSLTGLKFGILTYIDYSAGQTPLPDGEEDNFNRFALTRGYFTLKKKLNPWLKVRLTTDVHWEDKGDQKGDYNVRLKYFYGEIRLPDLGPLTNIRSEVGMGHMPWLDFEEHLNPYRCQGTMAVERAGLFNSADVGAGIMGYFGGKLDEAENKTGSHYYPGKFGSWHIGVYNGGGYHATENNQNKAVEGRVTIRPFPGVDFLAGFQLSYLIIYGEGNTEYVKADGDNVFPDYVVNLGMLSYQNQRVIFTGQYFTTRGNASGSLVDADFDALTTQGYSFFGNVKLPLFHNRLNLFARYDHFDADVEDKVASDSDYDMTLGGVAIKLYKKNMLLFVYETTDYGDDSGGKKGAAPAAGNTLGDDRRFQVVLQLAF